MTVAGEKGRLYLLSDLRSSLLNFSTSIGVMSLIARWPKNPLSLPDLCSSSSQLRLFSRAQGRNTPSTKSEKRVTADARLYFLSKIACWICISTCSACFFVRAYGTASLT